MGKVKIITDSCADLSAKQMEEYDIAYARMSVIEDGKEAPALLTWSDRDAHELYEAIRNGRRITTAQVSVEEFQSVFGQYLEAGYDIVYIGCSSKQSGSVNTGYMTAQRLLTNYPERKVFCIDSLNASIGEGMLAIEAAKKVKEGATAESVAEYIIKIRKTVQEFATVHTLDYLKRAGRVSGSSAFFGNLMGVKPIIIADAEGVQAAYKKVKGRQASYREIVSLLKNVIVEPEKQTVHIAHADCCKEELEELIELVKKEIPCKDVSVGYIGPIVGASIGPDAIGVWGFGKEVEFCLSANK